jgi:PleD family two-component response regulator
MCHKLIALERIENHSIEPKSEDISVTLSIGCVIKNKESSSTCEDILEASDKNLYLSKNNGRNQFTISDT